MLSLEEAVARITSALQPLGTEDVALDEACGRVLAEDIVASRELPAFDNSAMDGYAVVAATTQGAMREHPIVLPVSGVVAAGALVGASLAPGTAMRILTGAPVPRGADAVVMQEETEAIGNAVQLRGEARYGQHIRRAGEDMARGDLVLRAGATLFPGDLAVLAAQGCVHVTVRRQPRVWIFPTGDELVAVDQTPELGQVANSNSALLAAQVRQAGGIPHQGAIVRDDPELLRRALREAAAASDLIITCGGVSVGDFDHVRAVLGDAVDFWRVAIKPGKPVAFGRCAGVPLLGVPGNPASAFVCFELFGFPALRRLGGFGDLERRRRRARVTAALTGPWKRREFLRGWTLMRGKELWAEPLAHQGSGHLSSLIGVTALLEVPENSAAIAAGDEIDVLLLD